MSTATMERRKTRRPTAIEVGLIVILIVGLCVFAVSNIGSKAEKTFESPPGYYGPIKSSGAQPAQSEAALSDSSVSMKVKDETPAAVPAGVPRKIIYNADVEILVDKFADAEAKVRELVETHKGYLAKSDISSATGMSRRGQWTARIPIDQFTAFVAAVAQLGELQRNKLDTKDVTEEFYDVETRIKNKQVEENRLVQHLEKSTGKLEDILAVERELSRVRGEIEQMQGRIQLLTNLTALSTVVLTVQERHGYVPPTAPSFGTTIARTLGSSSDILVSFGEWLVLAAVALLPWSPFLALIAVGFWYLSRRQRRLALAAAREAAESAGG